MKIERFSIGMHKALASHLMGEFATASLMFRNGGKMKLIAINSFRRDHVTGHCFGEEDPCSFAPGDVMDVEMTVLDREMMSPGEMRDFGLVPVGLEQSRAA